MKRDSGNLEQQPSSCSDKGNHSDRVGMTAARHHLASQVRADHLQIGAAGEAIKQRETIREYAGGKRTQQ